MDTKGIIIEAFRKLLADRKFENITVQDILEEAHCARGTFYRHFKDKYDVMNYYYFETNQRIHSDPTLNGVEKIRTIIDSLAKNANYFQGVVDAEGTNSFQIFARDSSRKYFLNVYRERTGINDPFPERILFMADFLSAGYASVIKDWIIHDRSLPKDEIAECLYAMTPEEFRYRDL